MNDLKAKDAKQYVKDNWEMDWSEKKMRRIIYADKGFRRHWDEKFGMDFLGY